MTMIGKTLDLDLAPARRTGSMRLVEVISLPLVLLRALRNRREIATLHDFSDAQLADIGLTRDDLRASFNNVGRFADPSGYLTQAANFRRPSGQRRP